MASKTNEPNFWIDKEGCRFELIYNLIHTVDMSASACIREEDAE